MAKRLFQQSLSDHCVGRSLSFGKVMAYSPRGSLYHKRICLLYSVFKEHSAIQPIKINNSLTNFYRMINEAVGKGIYQLRLYVLHHYVHCDLELYFSSIGEYRTA